MKALYRFRFVLLVATAIVLIAATVVTQRGGSDTNDADVVLGHLGPTPGPPTSDAYVASKRAHLERLAKSEPASKAAALVSLKDYLPAPGVQKMLRSMETIAVFVRMPTGEGESLPIDTTLSGVVADRAADLRKEIQAEIDAIEEESPEATDIIAERKQALAKVNAECGCVFAVAVEGATATELNELAKHPQVRLVDVPDPPEDSLRGWELGPLVPRSS